MTLKQLLRKRNLLVKMAISLNGEEQKAIELGISALDYLIDNNKDFTFSLLEIIAENNKNKY